MARAEDMTTCIGLFRAVNLAGHNRIGMADLRALLTVAALQQAIVGREVVQAGGHHAYVVYPDGIGRSRLTSALIEKALGTRTTGRNWNTVLKLDALAGVGS